jgi:sorting nexin-29
MKLNTMAEGFLNESLNGFRKGRSCTDAIFSLKQILEKRRELNLPTYLQFLDYKRAYDSVDRSKLWSILESYDVQQNLINAIKSLYKNTEICIRISDTKISEAVTVNVGLCQGCGLPPVLFNIYIK